METSAQGRQQPPAQLSHDYGLHLRTSVPCPVQRLAVVFLVPQRVIVANLIHLYTSYSIATPAHRRRRQTEPLATPPPDPNSSTADRASCIVNSCSRSRLRLVERRRPPINDTDYEIASSLQHRLPRAQGESSRRWANIIQRQGFAEFAE